MAAVIELRTARSLAETNPPVSGTSPLAVPATVPHRSGPARPALTVIHGGRSDRGRELRRVFLVRRIVAAVVVVLVALALVGIARVAIDAAGVAEATPAAVDLGPTHVVAEGETLWSLAERIAPSSDPRDVIDRIVELNPAADLGRQPLQAGQSLRLPTAD